MTNVETCSEIDPSNDQHILSSPYPTVPIGDIGTTSAVEYILHKVQENVDKGHRNWVTNTVTGEALTLDQIEPMSRSVASALTKQGMGQGGVALYMTSDVTKIYLLVIGVWRAGGMVHSSYTEDTADILLTRIRDTKAAWVFCDASCIPQVKAATVQVDWPVEIYVFGDALDGTRSVDDLFTDDGSACPATPPNRGSGDPIVILCTSGTTGLSKGALYTNKIILRFIISLRPIQWTTKPTLFLTKCTHILGLFFPLHDACHANWIIMMQYVTKKNLFESIEKFKPSTVSGFPTYLRMIAADPEAVHYDRSSLETIRTGGVVIPEQFYKTMFTLPNVKNVFNVYGLTECGLLTTTIDLGASHYQTIPSLPPLTVGRLYPDTFLKVVDLKTGFSVGPNQTGELVAKSPVMASGYLNRPEATAEAYDKDGWFRTGDLGYYDNQGFVFVVDRIKETFKYFNNHISPAELEDVILKHPAVSEVTVVGIVDPDGGDRIPRAIVVRKPNENVMPIDIQLFANEKLASYKHLRGGVFFVDTLPKGKTGKVERSAAAKMTLT